MPNDSLLADMRKAARHLFDHALREASIESAFRRHVECNRGVLRIAEDLFDLDSYSRVSVITIGISMAAAWLCRSMQFPTTTRTIPQ